MRHAVCENQRSLAISAISCLGVFNAAMMKGNHVQKLINRSGKVG
jgi:hypothetical protein